MAEPSLELLQVMVNRVLDKLNEHDGRFAQVMNRLERVERALLAGQRLLLDRTESDTDIQHQIDDLIRRVQALESTP